MNDNSTAGAGDNSSTAQTVATGSQDLAALAGLFATDGVERNALATEAGYGTVISSALSILGILGLVKSSIKVALGADRCKASGWNVDSLRGMFGYAPSDSDRSTGLDVVSCLIVNVEFNHKMVSITKKRRKFDTDKVPLLKVGTQREPKDPDPDFVRNLTSFNLGNVMHDFSINQSPIFIATLAFICSGLTAWLLLLVEVDWDWVLAVATAGLHVSLMVMLAPPLWHAHQIFRPSKYFSPHVWRTLSGRPAKSKRRDKNFSFLQVDIDGDEARKGKLLHPQVLHFRGDVSVIEHFAFKVLMFGISALCGTAYICQYTILKQASNDQAIKWIATQAAFALARVLFWIFDPAFDDPRSEEAEVITLVNDSFSPTSLMWALTHFMRQDDKNGMRKEIPRWAWDYMQSHTVGELLESAKHNTYAWDPEREIPGIDPDLHMEVRYVPDVNFAEALEAYFSPCLSRTEEGGAEDVATLLRDLDLRLVLDRHNEHIAPSIVVNPGLYTLPADPEVNGHMRLPSFRHIQNLSACLSQDHEVLPDWTWDGAHFPDRGRIADFHAGLYMNWRHEAPFFTGDLQRFVLALKTIHGINFVDLEREVNNTPCALFLDQASIPVPRSFALGVHLKTLSNSVGGDEPADYVAECLGRDRKQQSRPQGAVFGCDFRSRSAMLDFVQRYLGHRKELHGLKMLKWFIWLSRMLDVQKQETRTKTDAEHRAGSRRRRIKRETLSFAHRAFAVFARPLWLLAVPYFKRQGDNLKNMKQDVRNAFQVDGADDVYGAEGAKTSEDGQSVASGGRGSQAMSRRSQDGAADEKGAAAEDVVEVR